MNKWFVSTLIVQPQFWQLLRLWRKHLNNRLATFSSWFLCRRKNLIISSQSQINFVFIHYWHWPTRRVLMTKRTEWMKDWLGVRKKFIINVITAASSRGSAPTWRRITAGYTAAPTSDQSTKYGRQGVVRVIFISKKLIKLIVDHLSKLEKASFNEFYETMKRF